MPLFERLDRGRREVEAGQCINHPDTPGLVNCAKCKERLCGVCRTRWHETFLCPRCVENSIAAEDEHPREVKASQVLAIRGFTLAMIGGLLFLLGLALLWGARHDPSHAVVAWSVVFMALGLVPGVVAIGQVAAVILQRGPLLRLASAAVVIASAQVGLSLGLLLISLWRN